MPETNKENNESSETKRLKVFFSYSSEDRSVIDYFYEYLNKDNRNNFKLIQDDTSISDKLTDIVEALKAQTNIMTPKSISIAEADVLESIWVVTTHLYNDIYDENIKESVKKNMEDGKVKYSYFITDTEVMKRRKERYEEEYGGYKNYEFITIKNSFMPFDEVVIYDADDDFSRWGYVQLKYNEDNLFLRLSDRNLCNVLYQLKKIYEEHHKNKK